MLVKGGYRRKEDSWSFVHTNDDIIWMARTETIGAYIEKQQRNFLAHIIRMENYSTTKRLLFNNNPSRMAGRDIKLYPPSSAAMYTVESETNGNTGEQAPDFDPHVLLVKLRKEITSGFGSAFRCKGESRIMEGLCDGYHVKKACLGLVTSCFPHIVSYTSVFYIFTFWSLLE